MILFWPKKICQHSVALDLSKKKIMNIKAFHIRQKAYKSSEQRQPLGVFY